MKKKLVLFSTVTGLLILLFHTSCIAQQISTFPGTLNINGTVELGDSPQDVINKFGQPSNTETIFWDIIEKNGFIYYYNGAEFFFAENELRSFILTSSSYKVNLDSFELKIGNNINTISTLFSSSYSLRLAEGTSIGLGSGDYQYLSIGTNINGIINEIELRYIP